MTVDEFVKELKAHDWFYMYSDDHRVYTKGFENYNRLRDIAVANEGLMDVMENYIQEHINPGSEPGLPGSN